MLLVHECFQPSFRRSYNQTSTTRLLWHLNNNVLLSCKASILGSTKWITFSLIQTSVKDMISVTAESHCTMAHGLKSAFLPFFFFLQRETTFAEFLFASLEVTAFKKGTISTIFLWIRDNFFLPKQSHRSRSILQDRSRSSGLFAWFGRVKFVL